mgnify:CR=1 FL=1
MLSADIRVKAVHVYSDIDEEIDFVIVVSENEDKKALERMIADACEDWLTLEDNLNEHQISVYDFISDILKTAGIYFEFFYKGME